MLAAAGLVVLGAAACQREAETPEGHAAKTAVLRYNQALVEAFASMDEAKLLEVTTEAERNRVGAIIAGLLSQGKMMIARQTSAETLGVRRLADDLMEVRSRETWEYEHRPLSARQLAVPPKTITYVMEYQVRLTETAWMVQNATTREEKAGGGSP